jgi:hypothetical protein
MRTMLTVAALVVFVVSTGLLEMANKRRVIALPSAMGEFAQPKVDATTTSGIARQNSRSPDLPAS